MRTHLCGVLRPADVGTTVRLCGWVARRREHGEHLAFVDLRDHSGIDPVRHRPRHRRAQRVGHRRHRHGAPPPEGTVNPGIDTGEVEIGDCTVEVLNEAEPPPFSVDDRDESDEPVRLRYRYVDLRRPRMQRNLRLRARVNAAIRAAMDRQGFAEIETPAAVGAHPRGLPRVLRARPPAPRLLLRAAPEPAAGQAAPHGGRLRPLLPDRPLPARRGPAGRPPVRVHPARHGVLLRHPGRRHGLRLRGRPRCGRGGDGGAAAADRADDVGRRPRPLRHRQARPALRHGAGRPDRASSRAPRSRPSPRRPSRRSWCPTAPPSPARGSTSSPSRPSGPGRRAWPGSGSVENGPVARRRPWPATCRRPKRCALLETTGAEPGDLILAVSDTYATACTVLGTLRAAHRRAPGGPGPAPLRLGRRLPHVRGRRRRRAPPGGAPPVHHALPRGPAPAGDRPAGRALAGLRPGAQRMGAGVGERAYPPPGHPVAGVRRAGHRPRGGRGPLRVPAGRLPLRGAAARRVRLRDRPAGGRSWPARRTSARSSPTPRPSPAPTCSPAPRTPLPAATLAELGIRVVAPPPAAPVEPLRRRRRPPPPAPGPAGRPAPPPHPRRDRGPGAPRRPRRPAAGPGRVRPGRARRSCGARPAPARPRWPACWPTPPPSTWPRSRPRPPA